MIKRLRNDKIEEGKSNICQVFFFENISKVGGGWAKLL